MALFLRSADRRDTAVLTAIYNSNPEFLLHHLGRERVDEAFLLSELEEMAGAGFASFLITEGEGGPAGCSWSATTSPPPRRWRQWPLLRPPAAGRGTWCRRTPLSTSTPPCCGR